MPTNTYHRLWCKNCVDWTLFNYCIGGEIENLHGKDVNDESNYGQYICKTCNQKHAKTLLSEIPEDKLKEQQKRFKEKRSEQTRNALNIFGGMSTSRYSGMFSAPGSVSSINESDAGLIALEKYQKERREERIKEINADIEAHKHLGRNEKCSCGSDKKYKQCCLKRIQSYY